MRDIVPEFEVTPENTCLETLSPLEAVALKENAGGRTHHSIVRCALAVLNSGSESDDVSEMLATYHDFDLEVVANPGGISLKLYNAPAGAFVHYGREGDFSNPKIIEGLRQHLFSVLRDLAFIRAELNRSAKFDLNTASGITDAVYMILRNAGIFSKAGRHKVVTCWGGHSIGQDEYNYSLSVGNKCGLRFMDVITGCGPGAMKGPMEGATIGHAKQRMTDGRYIGITEPGIIGAEAPNPIVNPLVIMPDIEKRLEAFVRLGQGVIIFPGGVGTLEEISYILGILTHPNNRDIPFPLIFTGPERSAGYWRAVDKFIKAVLGEEAAGMYQIIPGDAERAAQEMNHLLLKVKSYRDKYHDAYYFNTRLFIPFPLQQPFLATHKKMRNTVIRACQKPHQKAATLRRMFSAIVTGNVRPEGIKAVAKFGPYPLRGEAALMGELQIVLAELDKARRMKREGEYKPCFVIEAVD